MVFLCIDDDKDDLEFLSDALKRIDCNCLCHFARDGEEGLYLLSLNIQPDLIFLDINMPLLNGIETLRAIRDNRNFDTIPICMLSTSLTSADKRCFTNMGANFCVEKPASYNKLCEEIGSIVSFTTHSK